MVNPPGPPPPGSLLLPRQSYKFKGPVINSFGGQSLKLPQRAKTICLRVMAEFKTPEHIELKNLQKAEPEEEPYAYSMAFNIGLQVDPGLVVLMVSSAVDIIDEDLLYLREAAKCLEYETIDCFKRDHGEGFKYHIDKTGFDVHNLLESIPDAATVASDVADDFRARAWEKIEQVRELLKRISLSFNNQDPYYEFIGDVDALYSAIGALEFNFTD